MSMSRFPWRSVLIVEDDAILLEMYRVALRDAGFLVVAADDGFAALRAIEQSPPDVVVLDLSLPRLGGRDVYHEMKSHPKTRHIPIVVVSGTDMRDLDPSAFSGLLTKPFPPDALVSVVEGALLSARPTR